MIILIVVLCVFVALIVGFISISNSLNKDVVKIDEAFSGIDVALTKRYDVLTKMMDTCKSFVQHENEIMFEVIKLRSNASVHDKNVANEIMNQNYRNLLAVAENYPELKSSATFINLQNSIVDVEEHLQASRRMYNSNVSIYNQKIVAFPASLVASIKGLRKREFFEAESSKRQDVKISI